MHMHTHIFKCYETKIIDLLLYYLVNFLFKIDLKGIAFLSLIYDIRSFIY